METLVTLTSDGSAVHGEQGELHRLSGDHQPVVGNGVEGQAMRGEHGVLVSRVP
jgi:hypothetical protein